MNLYFVFDVESVGLFGPAFAVGWCVVRGDTGEEMEADYLATDPRKYPGFKNYSGALWVLENIPFHDTKGSHPFYNAPNTWTIREGFWRNWISWRKRGAVMVADCPYPVEVKFLWDHLEGAEDKIPDSPYPLLDVASVLLAAGLDPIGTYPRQENELPVHHPLADARQSARLFLEALSQIRQLQAEADLMRRQLEASGAATWSLVRELVQECRERGIE